MIESMTGYGKAIYVNDKKKVTVELKSINSKQLDLILRVPSIYRDQETIIRSLVSPIIERGKVDLTVTIDTLTEGSNIKLNVNTLRAYKVQIEELSKELDIECPKDLIPIILRLPEAFTNSQPEAAEDETEGLLKACNDAVFNLQTSRIEEGRKLYEFFFEKTEKIKFLLSEVEKFEKERIPKIKERLEQQLLKLESIEYDKGRLEQELIYYIEKLDVTEEKIRLTSHINYFEETLGQPNEENCGGKGKKLGFISQEMGREINTLGSKANDANMQKLVVMMKDELEQIKEQVLNVL